MWSQPTPVEVTHALTTSHAGRPGEPEAELGHTKDERDRGDCKTMLSWGLTPEVSLRPYS